VGDPAVTGTAKDELSHVNPCAPTPHAPGTCSRCLDNYFVECAVVHHGHGFDVYLLAPARPRNTRPRHLPPHPHHLPLTH